ncbi:MAG: tRNA epoxyqueuosine(34) reductase QueG [Planctomycetota bacterium]
MAGPANEHGRFAAAAAAQRLAQDAGFALCGIADAGPSDFAAFFADWLAAGRHGEMAYLAEHADLRVDPGRLVEGAVSVIVVADAYPGLEQAAASPHPADRPAGRIAKYAWGDDYHKTIKKRLHAVCDALSVAYPDHTFRATADTAPIFERELASRAGLGWTGKHTLMIHPRLGSYFLLGTIVTTLPMQTSEMAGFPDPLAPPTDHCGGCTRCIDACPTDAIAAEGYSLDATRCISYLTLEHRSTIAPALLSGMGDWVAGCDICQDVCPHNRRRLALEREQHPTEAIRFEPRYAPRSPAPSLDLLAVLDWSEEDRRLAFTGSALKRIKLNMLKRNALIALSNRGDGRSWHAVRQFAQRTDEDPLPLDTAKQLISSRARA